MTAPSSDVSLSPEQMNKLREHRVILVFDYRTLLESDDLDDINYNAWKEVLTGFGYGNLSFEHFLRTSMVHKSPAEVMASLCPYTTREEWTPLLAKRTSRLIGDVNNLCYAEVLPLQGIKDFIIDCTKNAYVSCVFLSPFPDEVTKKILDLAEMTSFIDVVHSYMEREYSLSEALKILNINIDGNTDSKGGRDATTKVKSAKLPDIFVFSSDEQGCKHANLLGCRVVGITSNGGYVPQLPCNNSSPHKNAFEKTNDENGRDTTNDRPPQDTQRHTEALLASGAESAVEDYVPLKYMYLFPA